MTEGNLVSVIRFGGLLLLLFASASAAALTSQHDLLLDLDDNAATGCTVVTPDGAFDGAESIVSVEVETDGLDAAEVVAVTRSECVDPAGDVFGAPTPIDGGWPVGVGEGVDGFHVIEAGFDVDEEYRFDDTRIGVSASNELGDSATLLDSGGSSIILPGLPPIPVPVATTLVLVLLALGLLGLGLLVLGRRGRLTFTAFVVLLGAGSAGAGAVYSGVLADWGPDDLLAETGAAEPDGGVDVRALFGQRAGGGLEVALRLDSALVFAAPPQPLDDGYTTELVTPVTEDEASGLLANDELGLPAAELASFGGGDLGGSVDDNAAGDSVTVGSDGSLTVDADGSFEFQAETGFDGPFSFDYRIDNVAGSAQAQVTIEVQRPPGGEDDAFDVLAGETLDTGAGALLANDSGWPDPAVSAFGGGDLGGSVDDNAAGDSVTVGSDGSLTVDADGQVVFTPASDFSGEFDFDYRIDNPAGSDTATVVVTVNQAPTITSPDSASCAVGSACAFDFTAEGHPEADIGIDGTLPTGVSFDAGSGSLSGTPEAGSGAAYALVVTASNGIGADAEQDFTLSVDEAPTITSADSLGCEVGEDCTFTFAADGYPEPSFSLPGLPAGLSLDAASGELTGQPDAGTGGEYDLVLEASNSEGSDSQDITLTIGQAPEITSADSLSCEVGQACSFTLTAEGFPEPDFELPGLPSGLSLDAASGELTGTPEAGTGEVYALTATANNSVGSDSQAFELTVDEAPSITSAASHTCQVGESCSFTFQADGHPDPDFSIAEPLPDGLSLDATSGQLSGTPAGDAGGVYELTLTAANGIAPDADQTFTLTIEQSPQITSPAVLDCEVGSSCSLTLAADGFPAPTLEVSGPLPDGVTFDGTDTIAGTPDAGSGAEYALTVTAANGVAPDDSQSLSLTVDESPVANDDPDGGIPADSSPGSVPYHGAFESELVVTAADGVLANDVAGYPEAAITTPNPSAGNGSVSLAGDGSFVYTPDDGFTGLDDFEYCIENAEVTSCATVTVAVGERPTASDDDFPDTLIGNTGIDTARSSGYSLFDLAGGDAISVSLVGTSDGDAGIDSASGTFSFDPAAGFNGTATLEYQVSNGFAETATGTVSFAVDDMVWYYDNTATSGGDGRLSAPFDSLAGASAASAGDIHFVHTGGADYTGGIGLLNGQVLMGQDSAGLLSTFLTPPVPDDSELPSAAGRPVIANAGGAGVTLAPDNTLTGFDIGATSGFGLSGSNFGTLAIDDVSITGSGPGVSLETGTVTGSGFDAVNATSGAHGIILTDVDGNVALGSGAVGGATTAALEIDGGSADVSFGGSLEPGSGGRPVLVVNKTGGLVELTGPVSSTADGLRLADNGGSTIRLAGGLDLATGANPAFEASEGGIVEVCDDNPCDPAAVGALVNTLETTTAAALDIENTTIGGNNLEFRSISAGTAASGPASGIVLMNTGSDGGLKVRGSGSAGSGGTIENAGDSGVVLVDTGGVALAGMTITGSATHGIDGTSVADFELADAEISDNGDEANEEGLNFVNLSGAVSLVDVNATGNAYNNLRIDNDSGTLSTLDISGGSFSSNDPAIGNHGILITPRGTAVIDSVVLDGVTLSDNWSIGMQVATSDSASVNALVVANSTITDNELGLDFSKAQQSSISFDIDGNQFTGQNSHGLNVFTAAGAGTTGSLDGLIRNNSVGSIGSPGSGSVIGNCLRVNVNGDTDAAVRVEGNTLYECPNGRGLEVIGRNGTGGLDITVVDNEIDHVNLDFDPPTSESPLAAIMIQSNCNPTCNTVRSDVRGNIVPGGAAYDFTDGFITLAQSSTSTLELVDSLGSLDCNEYLLTVNNGSVGVTGTCTLFPGPIDSP